LFLPPSKHRPGTSLTPARGGRRGFETLTSDAQSRKQRMKLALRAPKTSSSANVARAVFIELRAITGSEFRIEDTVDALVPCHRPCDLCQTWWLDRSDTRRLYHALDVDHWA